jgi:uncharacterized membrane protein YvbJ
MKCPNCGTDNPAGKLVCRSCGRRLRGGGGAQPGGVAWHTEEELMPRLRSDVRRLIVVTAIVLAVGLTLGFLTR